jgi:hypothetical protein
MSGVTSAGGRHEDREPSAASKDNRARPTGIAVIGDVPWGTHFCQSYQTRQDLVEILVPYFKAGLENNEFCMWVTSEPLRTDEAEAALRAAVPDLDRYVQAGQIEVLDYTRWYTRSGVSGRSPPDGKREPASRKRSPNAIRSTWGLCPPSRPARFA